ncbi:unnamed protein product [Tetraodon nigroviridis]|uniref:(spotted green pufferfish) hypothetical protein n=1 Tax=Tetraodon nigroviridis TaxID=99883 RepID=Q4SND1_TETNG|nr:unnamed protein product [Tetraodon nigroviridis]
MGEGKFEQLGPTQEPPQRQRRAKPGVLKLLVFLLGAFLSAAFVGLVYYVIHSLQTNECVSPACQWASARLSLSPDPFAHPCDYFSYACTPGKSASGSAAGWRNQDNYSRPQSLRVSARRGKGGNGMEDALDRRAALVLYLRELLESEDSRGSTAVQEARRFYQSCLDTRSIDAAGAEPFLALLQKLGGWAVSGQWNRTDFNSTLRQLMRDYATFPFFSLQSQAPAVDWLGCLRAAFDPLPLSEDDLVLLHNLPYLVQMSRIIGKWLNNAELRSSNPLHTYMIFHLLHTMMPALDSRFTETARNLSVALGGRKGVSGRQRGGCSAGRPVESRGRCGRLHQAAPRWKHCLLETERGFNVVFRNALSETFPHVHRESKLHTLKWRDPRSLQSVMKKVDTLIPTLWVTKDVSGEAELDLLFSEISTQIFFSSYVRLLSFRQKRRNKLLTEQTEDINTVSVTPFLSSNQLFFPLGMFVPPLFHSTYPSATVQAVGECVWTHYLAVTGHEEPGGAISLSAAQQQEVWLQYSALQIALQVSSPLHRLAFEGDAL